jgi:hypothetical protein
VRELYSFDSKLSSLASPYDQGNDPSVNIYLLPERLSTTEELLQSVHLFSSSVWDTYMDVFFL